MATQPSLPPVKRIPVQFLFEQDGVYTFMEFATYEQYELSAQLVGGAVEWLEDSNIVALLTTEDGMFYGIERLTVEELATQHAEAQENAGRISIDLFRKNEDDDSDPGQSTGLPAPRMPRSPGPRHGEDVKEPPQ
jgi:hypothetical protein